MKDLHQIAVDDLFKLPSGYAMKVICNQQIMIVLKRVPVFTKVSESLIDGYDSYFTTPTMLIILILYYLLRRVLMKTLTWVREMVLQSIHFLSAGRDSYGQLASEHDGLSFNGSYIPLNSLIAIGKDHLIYTTDGEILYGAGLAESGQLGNNHRFGTTESSYDSYDIIDHFEFVSNIRDVHICGQSTFVVTRDDKLWSFGKNTSGELATNKAIGHITQNPKRSRWA